MVNLLLRSTISNPKISAQDVDINECVAPESYNTDTKLSPIRHIPWINPSDFEISAPLIANTLPVVGLF
jgi:hypothetical protein